MNTLLLQDLERVCLLLLQLVREEYPHDYSLAKIVATWGDPVSDADLAALERFEQAQMDKNSA